MMRDIVEKPLTANSNHMEDIFRHIDSILLPITVHADHYCWLRILWPPSPIDDSSSLRRRLRRYNCCRLVCGLSQRSSFTLRHLRHYRCSWFPCICRFAAASVRRPLRLFDFGVKRSLQFSSTAVGLAIALNISFGAPGQIVGVWIYKPEEKAQGYPTGHWTNAALLLFVASACVCLLLYYRKKNTSIRRSGGERFYKY
jgi:hypothetical protein